MLNILAIRYLKLAISYGLHKAQDQAPVGFCA